MAQVMSDVFGYKEDFTITNVKLAVGFLASSVVGALAYFCYKNPFEQTHFAILVAASMYHLSMRGLMQVIFHLVGR
jgi:hypothetical protein